MSKVLSFTVSIHTIFLQRCIKYRRQHIHYLRCLAIFHKVRGLSWREENIVQNCFWQSNKKRPGLVVSAYIPQNFASSYSIRKRQCPMPWESFFSVYGELNKINDHWASICSATMRKRNPSDPCWAIVCRSNAWLKVSRREVVRVLCRHSARHFF